MVVMDLYEYVFMDAYVKTWTCSLEELEKYKNIY